MNATRWSPRPEGTTQDCEAAWGDGEGARRERSKQGGATAQENGQGGGLAAGGRRLGCGQQGRQAGRESNELAGMAGERGPSGGGRRASKEQASMALGGGARSDQTMAGVPGETSGATGPSVKSVPIRPHRADPADDDYRGQVAGPLGTRSQGPHNDQSTRDTDDKARTRNEPLGARPH